MIARRGARLTGAPWGRPSPARTGAHRTHHFVGAPDGGVVRAHVLLGLPGAFLSPLDARLGRDFVRAHVDARLREPAAAARESGATGQHAGVREAVCKGSAAPQREGERGGGGKPTQRARGHTRGARHATPRSAHARTHALEEVSARREECGAAHEHAQRLLLEQVADVPAGHLRRRRRQRSCNQHAAAPPRARPKSGGGARRMTAAGQADYVTMRWLSGWRRPVAGLPLRWLLRCPGGLVSSARCGPADQHTHTLPSVCCGGMRIGHEAGPLP